MQIRPLVVFTILVAVVLTFQNCGGVKLGKPRRVDLGSGDGGDPGGSGPPPPTSDPFMVQRMSAGGAVSCAIRDSELFCWGYWPSQSTIPKRMQVGYPNPEPVSLVATGDQIICTAKTSGDVFCAGSNYYGQLGRGSIGGYSHGFDQRVMIPTSETGAVTSLSAAENAVCAVKSGKVWCWGRNNYGQMGKGDTIEDGSLYSAVESGVTKVSVGGKHTCGLLSNGRAKCWGYNYFGQLGDNSRTDRAVPTDVLNSGGTGPMEGIQELVVGGYSTCALLTNQKLYCWGYNRDGQLGIPGNTTEAIPLPTEVPLPSGTPNLLSLGNQSRCIAIDTDIWCWGLNDKGQLGVGDLNFRNTPTKISSLTGTVSDLTNGYNHTCAVVDGVAWCWGSNVSSLLGNGTIQDSSVPVRVFSPLEEQ